MAAIPTSRVVRPTLTATPTEAVRSFLTPSFQCTRTASVARFSTSPAVWKADNNKSRGLSAIRRTGLRPRQNLSVMETYNYDKQQLPEPTKRATKIEGDPDHGLWDFFRDKNLLRTPVEEAQHGRAWTVHELRQRDWETLHQLWWVCVKERNRLATEKLERRRLKAGYGDEEADERDETVQKTMKAIIDTLVERNNAYKEAYALARKDPDIDLTRTERQYQPPSPYETQEIADEEAANEGLEDPVGAVPDDVKQYTVQPAGTSIELPTTPKDETKAQTNKL
ncbi:MRP-L47-domain-containing protein [Lentithecium fluviatile CBS 122367]|uniref:Large ribosomal subunit protein uL29m n=1 Tax=Lentithecium fluviatile CBS 122367 TaxID=1168545 RepID=A0A6G1IDZ6_9PLEO|nr:MRP-L47-domain-containing protein [Lentithecium fluviatile CBS 122367]